MWTTVVDHPHDISGGRINRERLLALMVMHGIAETKGEDLARFIDVTKGTGYNLLRPDYRARADTLTKLARRFGVSTDYLLGLTDRVGPCPPATSEELGLRSIEEGMRGAAEPHPRIAQDERRRGSRRADDSPPRASS